MGNIIPNHYDGILNDKNLGSFSTVLFVKGALNTS